MIRNYASVSIGFRLDQHDLKLGSSIDIDYLIVFFVCVFVLLGPLFTGPFSIVALQDIIVLSFNRVTAADTEEFLDPINDTHASAILPDE